MKKITILLVVIFVLLLSLPAIVNAQQEVKTTKHVIDINTKSGEIKVKETMTLQALNNESVESIIFWIQNETNDNTVNMMIDGVEPRATIQGNEIICNVSKLNFTNNSGSIQAELSYTLPKETEIFEKKILTSSTDEIIVKLNEKEIYRSEKIQHNSLFQITLYEPSEAPLSWFIIGFIVLLAILLGVVSIYSFKKQKSKKSDKIYGGSKELLTTQKKLLTDLLKDLEKQHRENKVSDDTYHKLKGKYKQEAVNTMKSIEDM